MKGIFNHFKTLNPIVNITASPLLAQSAQSNPTIPALTAPVLWTHHQVRNRSLLMLHTHQTSNAPSHKHAHVIIAWSIKYTHTNTPRYIGTLLDIHTKIASSHSPLA